MDELERINALLDGDTDVRHTYAEAVPTMTVTYYREFDRTDDTMQMTADMFDALKESISENGFYEPLQLHYNPENGYAILAEGNHRLRAARELDLSHVPLEIVYNIAVKPEDLADESRRRAPRPLIGAEEGVEMEPGHPGKWRPSELFREDLLY